MDKTRLEAFSDGVIAIIITIMVLEARSVSLALGTCTSMLKLITSIYKGVARCAIYTPWLGFMILMKPLIFIVTSWV